MQAKNKTGIVTSNKMEKSIVVLVTRTKKHPLYKKYVRLQKKFMAHDEDNKANVGDLVKIEESRPYSKNKSWVLTEIVREAPGSGA